MEVVIKEGERYLLWKLIGKWNSYEVVRLENHVLMS